MDLNSWLSSKVKKMKWWDISLVKLSVFGFALALAKLWPEILGLDWYWYAALFVVAGLIPTYKLFK